MSSAFTKQANSFFYEAETPVEVYLAPADQVVEFVENNADVLKDLLMRLYSGMNGVLRRQVEMMGGSASSRLILELVISARRFGSLQADGSYKLRLTEQEIASRTGLSRETVNREFSKYKAEGYLAVHKGEILIKSLEQLEDIVRF